MALSERQKAVFAFDKRIRHCGEIDEKGNTTSGVMRPGVQSLAHDEETLRAKLQLAIVMGMTETGVEPYGKPNYIIIHREKLMFIALPTDKGTTVIITAEPEFPLELLKGLMGVVRETSNL